MDMVITRSSLLPFPFPFPFLPCSASARWRCRCLSEDTSGASASASASAAAAAAAAAGEIPLSLPGRERRRLRQQRREANTDDPLVSNWREQVEDRLLLLESSKRKSKTQKFSISSLSELGPQWWALQVSRTRAAEIAAALARTLSVTFPDLQFKLYNPSVRERTILHDGFIRVKHRPLVPGTIYLHCIMDRHVHHIVETSQGVAGFVGSQVPIRDEQFFTKPKPTSADDIEAIILQEKQEQETADKAFQEKQLATKRPSRTKKINYAYLLPGVSIRVLSGPFADYTGSLKQLNLKKKKATVDILLFGKESSVNLNFDQIEAVTA